MFFGVLFRAGTGGSQGSIKLSFALTISVNSSMGEGILSRRITLFGCPMDALTMVEAVEKIERIIAHRTPSQHCSLNAAMLTWVQKNKRLLDVVSQSDIIGVDGQAVVWASRLLGKPLPERVATTDLMYRLIELAALKGYRVYFLGAREEVVRSAVEILKKQYPGFQVAGWQHGYFSPEEEKQVVSRIRDSQADILLVAMGTPQKEYFINTYLDEMQVPFCMGVGGAFDIAAGLTRRAPLWMQRAGLEWFYRFLQEPRRMWKRYLTTNTVFIYMVVKAFLRRLITVPSIRVVR